MLISPSAAPYDTLTPEMIAAMPFDGAYGSWEGPLKPSTQWRFHFDILRTRTDMGAVVHAPDLLHRTCNRPQGDPRGSVHDRGLRGHGCALRALCLLRHPGIVGACRRGAGGAHGLPFGQSRLHRHGRGSRQVHVARGRITSPWRSARRLLATLRSRRPCRPFPPTVCRTTTGMWLPAPPGRSEWGRPGSGAGPVAGVEREFPERGARTAGTCDGTPAGALHPFREGFAVWHGPERTMLATNRPAAPMARYWRGLPAARGGLAPAWLPPPVHRGYSDGNVSSLCRPRTGPPG